jgi:hypothetical protein
MDYSSLSKSIVISIFSAVCAYLLIFLYSNYVGLYFAYDFDIPAYVNLKGINFLSNGETSHWSRDALITILLSKPISAVIAGIGFLVILMMGTKKPVSLILFLFWLNVFAFNTAFGIFIDDAIAGAGTYEVAMAMNIGNISIVVISILLAFLLFKIGMMNGRLIIMSFPHQNLYLLRSRIIFFTAIFLIPWLLVLAYNYLSHDSSDYSSETLKNLPVVILLIPFITASKPENIDFKYLPSVKHSHIDIVLSILFIILSILQIIIMKNGIHITGY